jgi:hypothetical protein
LAILATLTACGGGSTNEDNPNSDVEDTATPDGTAGRDHCQLTGEATNSGASTILFGDLHAHTSNSLDGQLVTLPIFGRRPYGPRDACEFARYCADLDFWSVNDHAEEMLPRHWEDNISAIRDCNAAYGGYTRSPEMVSYLGWEWTQSTNDPSTDFGHHNVVLKHTCSAEIPDRPFAAPRSFAGIDPSVIPTFRDIIVGLDPDGAPLYDAAAQRVQDFNEKPECDPNVDTLDLPPDCHEIAAEPKDLYAKMEAWGLDAIAIPHGTAWGTHHAQLVTWRERFTPEQLSPTWSPVVEIHSGHGNSEEYRPYRHAVKGTNEPTCPEPTEDFTPCCWQAGEIVRQRHEACENAPDSQTCRDAVTDARREFLAAGKNGYTTLNDVTADDWGNCGQCTDCYLPALGLRPERSVQAALALTNFSGQGAPWQYRFGFVSSTDSHQSGPGAGYKEFTEMTDSSGAAKEEFESVLQLAESLITPDHTRQDSFNYGGGLIAVHADSYDRNGIWEAIEERRVYATTGERIELWFEMLGADGEDSALMGSELTTSDAPTFRVSALGAHKQAPGCPDDVTEAKSEEFIREMCFGECYNPTEERHQITGFEVVRITPQQDADEALASLIEDPWRTFECGQNDTDSPCTVEFTDESYAERERNTTYYVRALQEQTPVFNADTLRCERNEAGDCINTNPCDSSFRGEDDDCLAQAHEVAWSSPIYLKYGEPAEE